MFLYARLFSLSCSLTRLNRIGQPRFEDSVKSTSRYGIHRRRRRRRRRCSTPAGIRRCNETIHSREGRVFRRFSKRRPARGKVSG